MPEWVIKRRAGKPVLRPSEIFRRPVLLKKLSFYLITIVLN
ncbi:hypothetical protein l11_13710 [Neisseria weaveri LMG 5135]|nr:hypothetical protein l11_13710 [Neisseria weaveri LMG 5135]